MIVRVWGEDEVTGRRVDATFDVADEAAAVRAARDVGIVARGHTVVHATAHWVGPAVTVEPLGARLNDPDVGRAFSRASFAAFALAAFHAAPLLVGLAALAVNAGRGRPGGSLDDVLVVGGFFLLFGVAVGLCGYFMRRGSEAALYPPLVIALGSVLLGFVVLVGEVRRAGDTSAPMVAALIAFVATSFICLCTVLGAIAAVTASPVRPPEQRGFDVVVPGNAVETPREDS